jgi:cobalt-zinc-cadmium efflux system outer membrane protein
MKKKMKIHHCIEVAFSLAIATNCLLGPSSIHAAHGQEHAPLTKIAGLSFADILGAAVRNSPYSLEFSVRQEQAEAQERFASQWLAGRPSLQMSFYNDYGFKSSGLQEKEISLQLPIWRFGEMSEMKALGKQYATQTEAWQQDLRWQLAGKIAGLLADIELSELLLTSQQESTATAIELLEATQLLFEAGELSKLDVLQAKNEVLIQKQAEYQTEAMLIDAERAYSVLTGLTKRPIEGYREVEQVDTEVTLEHPHLKYLDSSIKSASGEFKQSMINAKGNPQISIGSRHERGDRFSPWLETFAVSVNIPIGGGAAVTARTSQTRKAIVDAQVSLRQARLDIQSALHEAEHELFVTRESLPLAAEQAAIAAERSELAKEAFKLGEITLQQVLMAVQANMNAQREWRTLQLHEQRKIIEFNHFLGVTP